MTLQSEINLPPLMQYLDGLVDQLRIHAAAVVDSGLPESIHQARVTTRRLKAASDLLRPILADKARTRLNRVLRKVRRQLGALRDLDVLVGHIGEWTSHDSAGRGAAWLQSDLEPTRIGLLADARDDKTLSRLPLKLSAWSRVREHILAHPDAVAPLLAESLHAQIDEFASRAQELVSGLGGVDPHQVRIAGKALRYTLEIAAANGHPLDESLFKAFKKMQDALGTWHDYVVLAETAMRRSADRMLAHHDLPMQRSVLSLAQLSLDSAEKELSRFNRHWGEQGTLLTESIRAAFPLSRAVDLATEPKTDPDPAGSAEPEVPDGPH